MKWPESGMVLNEKVHNADNDQNDTDNTHRSSEAHADTWINPARADA